MRPDVQVHVYRPRQVVFARERPRSRSSRRELRLPFSGHSRRWGAMVLVAFAIGLGLTQLLHGRIVALRAQADRLQLGNTVIVAEHQRLLAMEAEVASETQVVALAKRKLYLFAPDKRQVRHM